MQGPQLVRRNRFGPHLVRRTHERFNWIYGYAENSSKTTRRMQLVEIRSESGRKSTRRIIIECPLFFKFQE